MLSLKTLGLCVAVFATVTSAKAMATQGEDRPQFYLQLGTGATRGNNVLPIPLAVGLSGVVEWRYFGFEAGAQINWATYCEHHGIEGDCGELVTAELGPRLSLPVTDVWKIYVSTKPQFLRMTEGENNEYGLALRLGVVCQGRSLGGFLEAGETILFGDKRESPTIRASSIYGGSRVPAVALGLRF